MKLKSKKSPLLKPIFFVILVQIFGSLTLAQESKNGAGLPTSQTDAEIERVLSNVIAKTPSLSTTQVKVESGIVFIDGSFVSEKDATWFSDLAKQLPHVLSVVDRTEARDLHISNLNPIWAEIDKLGNRIKQALPALGFVALFLLAFYFLNGYLHNGIKNMWGRRIPNPFLLRVVTRLTLLPIWLLLLYFVLRMLGLATLGATLIGGTGLLGIVIGLSFKGIAENYLAGLLLATRSPFTRGDLIIIGEYKGYVQNLNMRGTTIIDFSGNLILIPNIMVIQSVVENQTANPQTRTSFTVGIGYQDSIPKAQDLIVKALTDVQGVIADPPPSVIVQELGTTRIELSVRVWFNVKDDREKRIRSRAMIRTKETLLANGFNLPNEVRELVFSGPLQVENVEANDGSRALTEKRAQEKKQAEANLADTVTAHEAHDPSPEDMLEQAEKNPLPINATENDLLKRS